MTFVFFATSLSHCDPELTIKMSPSFKQQSESLRGLNSNVVGDRSLGAGFKSRPGHIRWVYHLTFRPITFGGQQHFMFHFNNLINCLFTVLLLLLLL